MQFCQEACQVFGTRKRGIRYKASVIAGIFWKPFDVRFKNTLERIETHQALFLSEMQLEASKFTEFQFRKRQHDSDETNTAISQISVQISDQQQDVVNREQKLNDRFEHVSEAIAAAAYSQEKRSSRDISYPRQVSMIFGQW